MQRQVNEALFHLRYAIDLDAKCQKMAKTDTDFDPIRDHPRFRALVKTKNSPLAFMLGGCFRSP
ncbi:MAG: hypothetical protein KME16_19880 [Scytolyngbya sp. HA4215-MV1]|nr:hypothetical protein [Scytolyngbya sp. HA4215-MV1]